MATSGHAIHGCYQVLDPSRHLSYIINEGPRHPGGKYRHYWKPWEKSWIQGKYWENDSTLQAGGDPTGHDWSYIKLNTGANHDCNIFWGCDKADATERKIRGVYFKHHTNQAKFRPRLSGVALVYVNSNGSNLYQGIHTPNAGTFVSSHAGSMAYEGGDQSHFYWGVAGGWGSDGARYHESDYRFRGVLWHYETTWKSGSAADCIIYLKDLRFIMDAGNSSTPEYTNHWRVWNVRGYN